MVLIATRIFYFRINPNTTKAITIGNDAIAHLHIVKRIKKQKGKLPDFSDLYTFEKSDYPYGYHKIINLFGFSLNFLEKYGGYFPIFWDILLLTAVNYTLGVYGGSKIVSLLFPFLVVFIWNIGRSTHFTERAFGILFGNLYLLSGVLIYLSGNYFILLISILFFILFASASKFTWQAVLFFSVILSTLSWTPLYIGLFIFCFVVASLLTNHYTSRVFIGVVRHSIFCRTHLWKLFLKNSNYGDFITFLKRLRHGHLNEAVSYYFSNPILKLVSDNPITIIAVAVVIRNYKSLDIFAFWFIAGVLLVLFISTDLLKFLGEPERYMELAVIPVFVLTSRFTAASPFDYILIVLTVTFLAFSYVYHIKYRIRVDTMYSFLQEEYMSAMELVELIKDYKNKTILTIDMRVSFFFGYYNENNRFISDFTNSPVISRWKDYMELMPDRLAYPGNDIDTYIRKYEIDYMIVHKKRLIDINHLTKKKYYDFSRYREEFKNEFFTLYNTSSCISEKRLHYG
ncbi:MAG: hypothetical protein WC489_04155 [Patescibacteria group bacterium]